MPSSYLRFMLVLGSIGAAVIAGAMVVMLAAWPTATVADPPVGLTLYRYDPATGEVSSAPQTTFHLGELPAVRVDARSSGGVPAGSVTAAWFDLVGHRVSAVERPSLDRLTDPVPLSTEAVATGGYQFVLSVTQPGRPVTVLARLRVEISR